MKKVVIVTSKIVMTMLLCFLMSVGFTGLLQVILPDPNSLSKELVRLINGPKSLIVLLASVLIMYGLCERKEKWSLGLAEEYKSTKLVSGSLLGIFLVFFNALLLLVFDQMEILSSQVTGLLLGAFGISALIAICDSISEEVLIRGYVQGLIEKNYGPLIAIFLSAVPFAVLHSLGHDVFSHPITLINLFLAGVFLALVRTTTGSLWCPIGFHITWNLFNHVIDTSNAFILVKFGQLEWLTGGEQGFDAGLMNTLMMLGFIIILRVSFFNEKKRINPNIKHSI